MLQKPSSNIQFVKPDPKFYDPKFYANFTVSGARRGLEDLEAEDAKDIADRIATRLLAL